MNDSEHWSRIGASRLETNGIVAGQLAWLGSSLSATPVVEVLRFQEMPTNGFVCLHGEEDPLGVGIMSAAMLAKRLFPISLSKSWPAQKWTEPNVPLRKEGIVKALALQGSAAGEYYLASFYLLGSEPGVPHSVESAIDYYTRASRQGLVAAQYALGSLFQDGESVAPDPAEAIRWLRMAAHNGHLDALNDLGAIYAKGVLVPKDLDQARRLYVKAARRRHLLAMRN